MSPVHSAPQRYTIHLWGAQCAHKRRLHINDRSSEEATKPDQFLVIEMHEHRRIENKRNEINGITIIFTWACVNTNHIIISMYVCVIVAHGVGQPMTFWRVHANLMCPTATMQCAECATREGVNQKSMRIAFPVLGRFDATWQQPANAVADAVMC